MSPKNNLNGFLVIDKPYDMGSTKVVSVLKHFFHPTKIGHAGTLDPLATGVLLIAFGKATRLIPYVMEGKKTYQFTVKWGVETDSDDLAGNEIATSNKMPQEDEMRAILPKFIGEIMQTPNAFSAIKVDGKRSYDLARAGKKVEMKSRFVTIYDLKLLKIRPDDATFEVVCSKGTYVRTLAHDIAHALGSVGVVTMLHRTVCLPFDLTQAIQLEDVQTEKINIDNLQLIPMETVLKDVLALSFSETEIKRLSQGQRLSWNKLEKTQAMVFDGIYCAKVGQKTLGLVKKEDSVIRPEFIWSNIK
ncbi:MAG: tRNA pseudouridine(55) synthase TruB [Alphaproteobacteria bacterium]|nr:tRNA pseudouridine(55) synthase TruB [Alphaproteobacteria bacterium]